MNPYRTVYKCPPTGKPTEVALEVLPDLLGRLDMAIERAKKETFEVNVPGGETK